MLNIPPGTSFCIGASDGCLAVPGSNAVAPGIAALTIGTSGAVRVSSPSPVYNFPGMTFNYLLDTHTFICGGAINNGGNVFEWIFNTFMQDPHPGEKAYSDLFKKIEGIEPGCKGLIFLPYINGERAPLWDEQSCGVFFGIRSYHTHVHFARAAIEGICFALLHILEHIEPSTSPIARLNVSGGIVHSETWLQILADFTGKEIRVVLNGDASAIGAAILGMRSMGIIHDYQVQWNENEKYLKPRNLNQDVYRKYYPLFKQLYISLKDSMHYIHNINN
jgi:gluconokinase